MNHGKLPLDNWQTPWAVRSETLRSITLVMRGHVDPATIRAELEVRAAAVEAARQRAAAGAVAVIPLRGLITPRPSFLSLLFGGGGGLEGFRAELREALGSDEIGSILVDIDSPGGSVALVAETAAELRAARGVKPIVAISNTMAASAAYWIGAQADELVVTPSGEVGSIGVFSVHEDWSGFNEQMGITPTYISAGKYKTEWNPDTPLSDEAREAEQLGIDEYYALFVADVAKGRDTTPAAVRDGFGEGRMVTAKRAVKEGIADRVESYEATLARLAGARAPRGARAELERPEPAAQETQTDDKPDPKEASEEERARINRLVAEQWIQEL